MLTVNDQIRVPLTEFRFTFARSGGPGGQNVQKVSTKARLEWDLKGSLSVPDHVKHRLRAALARRIDKRGVLHVTSQRFRDQGRNIADCLEKLRAWLEQAARPPKPRKKTRPPRAAKAGRLAEKRRRSRRKELRRAPGLEE